MAEKAIGSDIEPQRIKVSSYEKASSWLLTLLIFIGATALVLVLIVLSNRAHRTFKVAQVEMADLSMGEGEGGGDGRAPGGTQLENPNEEAVAGLVDKTPDVQDNLTAVTEVVVEKSAQLTAELDDPAVIPRKQRGDYGTGGGTGGGSGPGRGWGHGPGRPGLPRRWELHFIKGNTLEVYAKQLDFFGIELGVLLPDNKVICAFNLKNPKPDTKIGDADKEKRYYLTWRGEGGDLQKADRELLARAGVDTNNRLVLKFLPPAVEQTLANMEKTRAGGDVKKVNRTRFGIQAAGDGYTFYILEQSYK